MIGCKKQVSKRFIVNFLDNRGFRLCEVTNHHTDRMIGYKEPTPEAVGPLNEIIGHVPVHKVNIQLFCTNLLRVITCSESNVR